MRFNQKRSGVTAVEFALTTPILFLFVFGAYELSRANMMMHTTEAACYESARLCIVPGATAAECKKAAQQMLATAGIRNAKISVSPRNLKKITPNISVSIKVKFKDNTFIPPFFMGDSAIERSCVLTREKL